ncbi:hypothetical protein [Winogradskyella pacifica]|uniref:Uncharacterized protein n=1 Tax=Winogradskyella pacifica TaxID=664642 RepID=A0A3D9N6E9_9FLAO|nr:hypothetical protein [Winogradskyella pacifica]REE27654.1 hypothetical protein DFQ09_101488 [Winogradskyella pacifica]
MKNIAISPTIWQPISYLAYITDKKENPNRKKIKDAIIKTAGKDSRNGKLKSGVMSSLNSLKTIFIESTVFTNTFHV